MADRETMANDRFACDDKERALFEAGIKMGTIYHQFVGTPFCLKSVESLEKAIESAISVQPYVTDVKVRIDRSGFIEDGDLYSYKSLTGEMIDAVVSVKVGGTTVVSEMRYDVELGYPLMFVSDIRRS